MIFAAGSFLVILIGILITLTYLISEQTDDLDDHMR